MQHKGCGEDNAKNTQFAKIMVMIKSSKYALCTRRIQALRNGLDSFKQPHETLLYLG